MTPNRELIYLNDFVCAGQICNNEGQVGKPEDVSDDSSTTTHDFPGKTNIAELEIPLVMKKDENVEKAEACTKELENVSKTVHLTLLAW